MPRTAGAIQPRPWSELPPPVLEPSDLQDLTSTIVETCSALALSLREGDVEAAERLFGFVVDQMPDRRLAVTDVLAPLAAAEMTSSGGKGRAGLFAASCSDLLMRLRRPVVAAAPAVLYAPYGGMPSLTAQMVALLLDDAHVPAVLVLGDDPEALRQRALAAAAPVTCVVLGDAEQVRGHESLIRTLRRAGDQVLVVSGALRADPRLVGAVGATAGAWEPGETADLVLRLRGPLSSAETEVLRLAADGCTNVRIAHELGISVSAVKARFEAGYAKLGALDRTHAVAIALRRCWLR